MGSFFYLSCSCRLELELQLPLLVARFACQVSSIITSLILPSGEVELHFLYPCLRQHGREIQLFSDCSLSDFIDSQKQSYGEKCSQPERDYGMSGWQVGPASHLWVVKASSHLDSCMAMESSLAVVFITFLLSWDLYVCPQTLALVSACSRSSSLIRTLVFLCWCKLCFHAPAVEYLTMKDENQKKKRWAAKMVTRRLLLWLLWCVLTVVLSAVSILYQVGSSVEGSGLRKKTLPL